MAHPHLLTGNPQTQVQFGERLADGRAQHPRLTGPDPVLDGVRYRGQVTVEDPQQIRTVVGHLISGGPHQHEGGTEQRQCSRPIAAAEIGVEVANQRRLELRFTAGDWHQEAASPGNEVAPDGG